MNFAKKMYCLKNLLLVKKKLAACIFYKKKLGVFHALFIIPKISHLTKKNIIDYCLCFAV